MCGICGEVVYGAGLIADAAAIAKMTAAMQPRGPDGGGQLVRSRFGFGHRRLKIIDLSDKAAQPMVDPELGLEIAFNGCIYNYPELRAELKGKGYRFFSSGDTEVILKAYHAWGTACVERFLGMFAFAIHERDTGRVVLARDRFGIKPLYLQETPDRLRFASSLPAHPRRRGRRYVDRPRRAGALSELPRRGAAAANDPERRAQIAAGHYSRDRA